MYNSNPSNATLASLGGMLHRLFSKWRPKWRPKNKNDYKFENICFIKQQKSAIIIVRDYTSLKNNNIKVQHI